jgi:hypothetical protein
VKRNMRTKLWAGSVVLLIIAVALAVGQLRYFGWPSVDAEILGSRLVHDSSHDRPGGPEYATFRPQMTYRFTGGDGQLREATTFVGPWSKKTAEPERVLREYPVGSQARISTDPRHPEQTRFNVGVNLATFGRPLGVFVAAAICGIVAWRTRRGQTSA